MDEKSIKKRIPDILNGIRLLRNKSFTYKKAMNQHMRNIEKAGINKKALFLFDSPKVKFEK